VGTTRRSRFSIARLTTTVAIALLLVTCGEDKPFECTKPAECVGRPGGGACKVVGGKGRCVVDCAVVDGKDNCPPSYHCTGKDDAGGAFCEYKP
jgi:hypothetical protein